eukprot:TRINITY_DN73878_c0_g1_i1.p1 TRINITY_DN73878_c0_g1~~TRINITY_DN73878_c0_g1_i1.p1  ORF type:complete len:757 (-),score=96.61 TRINITY_DN73878_c0_g1_i1:468-2738(-)
MGKNRPPKKVRELLVDLEKRRCLLAGSPRPYKEAAIASLEQLIACAPEDYERFIEQAEQTLRETQESACVNSLVDNGGFWNEPWVNVEQGTQDAWKAVCDVRTQMHITARASEEAEVVTASNRWRKSNSGSDGRGQHERGMIRIVPHVSLAFADGVTAGLKKSTKPVVQARDMQDTRKNDRQHGSQTLVWLRSYDLRLHDNPALTYAAKRGYPVHFVFIWSDKEDAALGKWKLAGTAAALWVHHALASLDRDIKRRFNQNISFQVAESTSSTLSQAAEHCGADVIVSSKAFDALGHKIENEVSGIAAQKGIDFKTFNSFLLNDIEEVRLDLDQRNGAFGTLVPFLFACNSQPNPPKPQPIPAQLPPQTQEVAIPSAGLDALGLSRMPVRKDGSVLDWGAPILASWDISESAALSALRSFLAPGGGISRYETERHLADASAVARISPYLRHGMLSCRLMYWESKAASAKDVSTTFWRRLVWRDLAYWQLRLFPDMTDKPVRQHYAGQWWNTDKAALDRWRCGRTGYPLVDAGMRELWSTGWMSQNVRMAAAIHLCEHMSVHWVEGARWFHHTLVDADPAINPMMWQNAGKSGLDQWNFTMDPAEFGRRMDPTGDYVRRWCPELRSLPARFIHCPWEAPERLQRHLSPGSYPPRLVQDLDVAAADSCRAIREQRVRSQQWNDVGGYDLIVIPRGSTVAHDGRRMRLFTKKDYRLPDSDHGGYGGRSATWRGEGRRDRDVPRQSQQIVLSNFMKRGVGS